MSSLDNPSPETMAPETMAPDDFRQRAAGLSRAVRAAMTAGRNGWATPAHPEAGIGEVTMNDGPLGLVAHGFDEREISTLLPSATTLAASWDTDVAFRVGQLIGAEARDAATSIVLGPNLGLPLSPLSGRSFEMYSEDPWLTGTLAAAFVTGVQSQGVGSCVKHLVGNDTETRRQFMNAVIDDVTLREISLLPFEMAVEAGAWMAMAAYNRVNGVPAVEQAEILGIVKDEWGFDGVVVSDWFATKRTAETANAGVDLEMPGPAKFLGSALADAVAQGQVDDDRLTDMAARFLRLATRVGAADQDDRPSVVRHDARETLRAAAAAGFTLLTNNGGILPLAPLAGRRVAVIGPNAATPCYQGGTFGKVTIDPELPTPSAALRRCFRRDGATVTDAPGATVAGLKALRELQPVAPDGTPGIQIEYFTDEAPQSPAASEVRPGSSLVWFQDIPGIGGPDNGGRIRLTATLTADVAGSYTFCVGGTGDAVLTLDGVDSVRWGRPETSDIMGVVARGDTAGAPVQLAAGQRVTLVAETTLTPGRVQSVTVGFNPPPPTDLLTEAERLAADSDVVILIVGDNTSTSRESADRNTTALDVDQIALIERVTAANPRTVVVVNASRSVDMPWADQAAAVLMVWFPGQEFGTALGDVLTGRRAPGGRLPVSIAHHDDDYAGHGVTLDDDLNLDYAQIVPGGHGHLEKMSTPARFAFGHGLAYTTFECGEPHVDVDHSHHIATVTVPITNTGDRPGREVIQVYGRTAGERYHRLVGYGAAELAAGASTSITVELPLRAFSRWDTETRDWAVPVGQHQLRIGRSAEHTLATHDLTF